MIKGCQKRMIFIKNTGCNLFDEAYFVLKSDVPVADETENDIIRMATAIINEHDIPRKKRKKLPKWLLPFFIGLFIGTGICSGIFFIIF